MSSVATLMRLSAGRPQPAADDVRVTRARILGTRAWMMYRADDREWARRRAEGQGAILALDLLDTLMDLPAGLPVPLSALTSPARRRLCQAPPGAVRIRGDAATRQVVPAVTPLLAVVRSRSWRDGLAAASRFASYCPRIALVPPLGADAAEALALAREYGIGMAISVSAFAGVVLDPEPVTDWEPTPAWWWLCEDVYRQATAAGR